MAGYKDRKKKRAGRKVPVTKTICDPCYAHNCNNCLDIKRVILGLPEMCGCTRKRHAGEPRDNQIKDPVTGTVYAPGLEVPE